MPVLLADLNQERRDALQTALAGKNITTTAFADVEAVLTLLRKDPEAYKVVAVATQADSNTLGAELLWQLRQDRMFDHIEMIYFTETVIGFSSATQPEGKSQFLSMVYAREFYPDLSATIFALHER